MYLSRMLNSLTHIFDNVIQNHKNNIKNVLKYIAINLHDTNISNILRFLGYFDEHGFDKFVRFSSSIRFELVFDKKKNSYRMRIVFDDEEIELR